MCTSTAGGKMALAEWRDIAFNGRRVIVAYDGDVVHKESVQKAMRGLGGYPATKGATVEYLHLPDTDDKTGLDDYLVAQDVAEIYRLVQPTAPPLAQPKPAEPQPMPLKPKLQPAQPISLSDAHTVFRKWFGDGYEPDALDAELACVPEVYRTSWPTACPLSRSKLVRRWSAHRL
jgi:hypothetical protein